MVSQSVVNQLHVMQGAQGITTGQGHGREGRHPQSDSHILCLNTHSRMVGALAHHPDAIHRGVERAEYPELLKPWELSPWLCSHQHSPGTRVAEGKGKRTEMLCA